MKQLGYNISLMILVFFLGVNHGEWITKEKFKVDIEESQKYNERLFETLVNTCKSLEGIYE